MSLPATYHLMDLVRIVALVSMFTVAIAVESAQDIHLSSAGLSVKILESPRVLRGDAPSSITVTLTSRSARMREGRLQIRVHDGPATLFTWTSDVLALAQGDRTSNVMLPPLGFDRDHVEIMLSLHWLEDGAAIDLGTRVLGTASTGLENAFVALCLPLAGDQFAVALRDVLPIEHYSSKIVERKTHDKRRTSSSSAQKTTAAKAADALRLRTTMVRLSEDQVPRHGYAWCAYDIAVIADDRIDALDSAELFALQQWVRAGGSCCLLTRGETDKGLPALLSGALEEVGSDAAPAHRRYASGLGRIVVAPVVEAIDRDNPAWRASIAWLWKFRAGQAATLTQDGSWTRHRGKALERSSLMLTESVTRLLWPRQVTIIPVSLILIICAIFVFLVGPGDWFILGIFKLRQFTWLFFPAVAIACTWSTVALSKSYLGTNDQRRAIEIVDVDARGQTVRDDRIELIFNGYDRLVTDKIGSPLWSTFPAKMEEDGAWNQPRSKRSELLDTFGLPEFHVTADGSAQVSQPLRQWTPALRRTLSFAERALPWKIDFTDCATRVDVLAWSERIVEVNGNGVLIVLFQGSKTEVVHGDPRALEGKTMRGKIAGEKSASADFLRSLCVARPDGWLELCAQNSPAGGATFADLPILDSDDDRQSLLVIAEWRDDTLWVARRLFRDVASNP
jgi:hypothetical protein